jgi:hypothetical protein
MACTLGLRGVDPARTYSLCRMSIALCANGLYVFSVVSFPLSDPLTATVNTLLMRRQEAASRQRPLLAVKRLPAVRGG